MTMTNAPTNCPACDSETKETVSTYRKPHAEWVAFDVPEGGDPFYDRSEERFFRIVGLPIRECTKCDWRTESPEFDYDRLRHWGVLQQRWTFLWQPGEAPIPTIAQDHEFRKDAAEPREPRKDLPCPEGEWPAELKQALHRGKRLELVFAVGEEEVDISLRMDPGDEYKSVRSELAMFLARWFGQEIAAVPKVVLEHPSVVCQRLLADPQCRVWIGHERTHYVILDVRRDSNIVADTPP